MHIKHMLQRCQLDLFLYDPFTVKLALLKLDQMEELLLHREVQIQLNDSCCIFVWKDPGTQLI